MRRIFAALLLLAGCQPIPHPFADIVDLPTTPALKPPDSAGVVVLPVAGAPEPIAGELAVAFAAALLNADVPASNAAMNRGSYRLATTAVALPASAGETALMLEWKLASADGKAVGSGQVRRDVASASWQKGDGELTAAIAREATPAIVALVSGDAPLPARDVDATVAMHDVAGAPGDGGTALASAIGVALGRAGVDVAAAGANARFALSCQVAVAPAQNGQQQVTVRWVLVAANGRQLGEVSQHNAVPAGSLDAHWGDIAFAVASAAAPGIAELVERARQAPAGS